MINTGSGSKRRSSNISTDETRYNGERRSSESEIPPEIHKRGKHSQTRATFANAASARGKTAEHNFVERKMVFCS